MVIVASTQQDRSRPHILNSDGQPHRVLNVVTIFTLVDGLVSFAIGMFVRNAPTAASAWHITATVSNHDQARTPHVSLAVPERMLE